MGTSISQGSPKTSNWKPVLACYSNDNFSNERIINEVWRASENEKIPFSSMMKSDIIFECLNIVNSSINYNEAIQKFDSAVLNSKQNTIVAEFAKRIIPKSFLSDKPAEQWKNNFFVELTNYVVSRDASGFVGKNKRNESVNDLITFKKYISNKVNEIVGSEKIKIKNKKDWNVFVDSSIAKLKSVK
jgi:hypothetical protein